MRVCSLVLVLVLASGTAAMAQNKGSGVKAGVNFADLAVEGDEDVTTGRRIGFIGGIFFQLPVAPQFSIQFEGLYAQKGAEIDDDDVDVDGKIKIDYFQFPILVRWDSTEAGDSRFNVFAGPSFNIRHRARQEDVFEAGETDINDIIKEFDLGLVVGAGMEFGNFLLDGRYEHGLRTINQFDTDLVEIKNRAFSIMAGFRF